MNVLTISDMHNPFQHPDALDFLSGLKREVKPDVVVCLGDLGDQHGWSRHGRHPDAPGQGDEDSAMIRGCKQLYKLFPNALACIGNHDKRLAKACARAGVPKRLYRSVAEIYESPKGWKWGEGHVVDGIAYVHGEGFSGQNAALSACSKLRCSAVIGHIHAWAGVQYHNNGLNTVFGCNAGCLIDTTSIAMEYAKTNPNKQVIGTAVVLDGVPCFRPMR